MKTTLTKPNDRAQSFKLDLTSLVELVELRAQKNYGIFSVI